MSACAGSNADDARVQKAEVNRRTVLLRFGLSIWATVHPGLARIRRWGGLSRVCDPHPGRTRGKGQPTDSDQRAPSTRHRASVSRPTACTAIPLAREHRRVRVPQVAKAGLGPSPAPQQTLGKRTPRYVAAPVITCWHSRPVPYARDGTLRHFLTATSRIGDAFARRRSGVRLPCGPPLICSEIVPGDDSPGPPDRPPTTR